MKPDHSSAPTVAERFGAGTSIRHIDRRLLVIRIRETSLRWVAMPAFGVFAAVLFSRLVETGSLLDVRTAGMAAGFAMVYGTYRAERRRLVREAEDLERARSPIPPSESGGRGRVRRSG